MVLQLEPDGARFRILRPVRLPRPAPPRAVRRAGRHRVVPHRPGVDPLVLRLAGARPRHAPACRARPRRAGRRTDEAKTHIGPDVDREEADRILRDAMASLGTPVVRRWLMWTAVILATAFSTLRPRWRWAPLVVGHVGGWWPRSGIVATLDLLDVVDWVPWMADRRWSAELALGVAVRASSCPWLVSLLWGRLWRAGPSPAVALALLLHVTVVVALDLRASTGCSSDRRRRARGRRRARKANLAEADTSEGRYLPAE